MNCIIVDDEPIAQQIIEDYILKYSELNLVAKCRDIPSAFNALRKYQVDLIFLDIQMPKNTGIEFVKSLANPPKIIFVTAYPQYAVEGFEENAVDYLLKPVSFLRFARAIQRVFPETKMLQVSTESEEQVSEKTWLVKSGTRTYPISIDEILVIEGMENYVKIVCKDREIVALNTLRNIQRLFEDTSLTRIHKSYIVNLREAQFIESASLTVANKRYMIGPTYRKDLLAKMNRLFDSLE